MSNIINLTPHNVVINGGTIPPSGIVARVVASEFDSTYKVAGAKVIWRTWGDVEFGVDIDPHGDTVYIVSSIVLEAMRMKNMKEGLVVVAPDTGSTAIRKDGQIVAVTRWVGYEVH